MIAELISLLGKKVGFEGRLEGRAETKEGPARSQVHLRCGCAPASHRGTMNLSSGILLQQGPGVLSRPLGLCLQPLA